MFKLAIARARRDGSNSRGFGSLINKQWRYAHNFPCSSPRFIVETMTRLFRRSRDRRNREPEIGEYAKFVCILSEKDREIEREKVRTEFSQAGDAIILSGECGIHLERQKERTT